jgi:hypothetical protein
MRRKKIDDFSTETPQEEMDICKNCPFPTCSKGECDYFLEMRRKIKKPRTRKVCGECKHFRKGENERSGTCAIRPYCTSRNGFIWINQQKVPFLVYFAKTACKKFK